MNTGEHNALGRRIFQGPRGGRYVLSGGRKVYKFPVGAPAGSTVPRNILGRVIHTGPRGGRYILVAGRKVYKFFEATVASPPGKIKVNTNFFMNKKGRLTLRSGAPYKPTPANFLRHVRNVHAKNRMFLNRNVLPFKNETEIEPSRLALFDPIQATLSTIRQKTKYGHPSYKFQLFKRRSNGRYGLVRLNDTFVNLRSKNAKSYGMFRTKRNYDELVKNLESRTSPNLMNMMINRIFVGGRGTSINVSNLSNSEKVRLARRFKEQIQGALQLRTNKQREANAARARRNMTAAAAAMERVGFYDDYVRAMTRGLRAVEPLSGRVKSPRITVATTNRYTPGGPGEENVVLMSELEKPHVVIKVPGTQTLYLNPNSLIGLIKNSTGANIAPGNLRDWLRMARRNFPNEPLFRHYISRNKNVSARHIRFSKE
jgi:hypothetical protein